MLAGAPAGLSIMKPKRHTPIPPQKRGPNGERLCRWCEQPVPKGRRTFCSSECVHEGRLRSDPSYLRMLVKQRDLGICAVCGCDSDAEYRRWREARKQARRLVDRLYHSSRFDLEWVCGRWEPKPAISPREVGRRRRELEAKWVPREAGWTSGRATGWDMDHIVPVEHGGGSCGLDNLQTLCHPCHKRKTAQQARERASRRTGQQELGL